MRKPGLSTLQYLLYALLMFALTGCGASTLSNLAGNGSGSGSVAAKLAYKDGKTAAKTLASAPAGVTSIAVTVTGTDTTGRAVPVVRGTIDTVTNQGTVAGIYPGKVTLVVQAKQSDGTVVYEGFAIGVTVGANATTTIADPIVMSPPVEKTQDKACIQCHETTLDTNGQNLVADFKQSGHYTNSTWTSNPTSTSPVITGTGCAGCHGPSHNYPNAATDGAVALTGRCYECHGATLNPNHTTYTGGDHNTCDSCHVTHNFKLATAGCVGCHSVAQNAGTGFVQDNNGVRVITDEFAKWSHHVTGVTLNDAHCAACHLEGKISGGQVVVDPTKHMADATTHLRNADSDADIVWDPATPNHTSMDNFCMSCHDGNGATSAMSVQIQAFINSNGLAASGKTASATNPFGDTISNRYDKMQRPAVVDAYGQFATSNPSHHAVRGQRYTKRTRVVNASDPRAMTAAEVLTFTNNSGAVASGKTVGARTTIYDSRVKKTNLTAQNYDVSKFVADYQTLSGPPTAPTDKSLGDDSILHCGDCHTVGQYRLADVNVLSKNKAVIGAHGSNNEYLLRNSIGTDERHVGQTYSSAAGINYYTNVGAPLLVCFNCHSYQNYGSIGNATGANGTNHAGEYANSNRCNGPVNTITFSGYTTGNLTDGEQYVTRLGEGSRDGEVTGSTSTNDTDFSNLFGMQCANCHNSGPANAFGGIHGSKVTTYVDANGSSQKAYRFLPGLGNTKYVPGSAAGVGSVSDLNWEVKSIGTTYDAGKTTVTDNGGCYTLVPEGDDTGNTTQQNAPYSVSPTFEQKDYTGSTNMFGTWGGCDDHRGNAHGKAFASTTYPYAGGTVPTGGAGVVRKALRPVNY